PGIAELLATLDQVLGSDELDQLKTAQAEYRALGMDKAAAASFARLPYLCSAAEIVSVASKTGVEVVDAAKAYFALDAALQLGKVLKLLQRVAIDDHWDRQAIAELHDDIVEEHRRLAIQALTSSLWQREDEKTATDAYGQTLDWLKAEVTGYSRWERLLTEMESRANLDLAVFLVAVRALGRLNAVASKAA
ncbi:MAG: NAD-glutamate dehydrogenase, partial [Alphaproteobacteria bacterium]|nr:NAD-glutamate dehydrogenase [Alphaproteobacteria bacterium]